MGWARIDDGFHDHPKLIGLSLEALGLWVKCLTWAHRHNSAGTLGHIPEDLPKMFAGSRGKKLASELFSKKLWDESPELGGWLIHDYVDYLPASEKPQTASEVSKARSAAGRRGAAARWAKEPEWQDDSNLPPDPMASANGKPMPPTRPDPTSPEPTTNAPTVRTRATRIPDPFVISQSMRVWAGTEVQGLDIERSTAKFVDYWRGKSGKDATKADWPATWRNWLRRDHENGGTQNGRASPIRQSTTDQRVNQALDLARIYAERESAEEQIRMEIEA